MRILHILYGFGCGGAERFVADLSNAQHAAGHDVSVCIIRPANPGSTFCTRFLDDEIPFASLDITSGITIRKMAKVKRYIDAAQPDIVHCHHNVMPYVCFAALSGSGKFIHTIHSEGFRAAGGRADRLISKFLYRTLKVVPVAISDVCADSFNEVFGMKPTVIVNGRSVDENTDRLQSVRDFINGTKRDENTVVFLHVARFHEVKNQNALFEAFTMLEKRGVNCSLIVLGDGFETSGLLDNLPDNVHYVGAVANVADYLACCDAFCLSSFSEGLPISLLEALSFGLTSVCTPVGGMKDVILDGKTGYLSSGVSSEEFAVALERAYTGLIDKDVIMRYYLENFSIESCSSKYMDIYEA